MTFQRALGDPEGPVQFELANTSMKNGFASVCAPQELTAVGVLCVRGDVQTEPGHSGQLVIRAMLDGNTVGTSEGFSVCSHPTCVQNGPQYVTITLGPDEESDNSMVGLKVWVHLQSDSNEDADLSAVCEKEIVASAHDFTGAATKAPPSGNSGWQPAHQVEPDRHRLRADVMNFIDQTQLHGADGGWSNDQLDVFTAPDAE